MSLFFRLNNKPLWTVFEGEVTASFILAKLKKKEKRKKKYIDIDVYIYMCV